MVNVKPTHSKLRNRTDIESQTPSPGTAKCFGFSLSIWQMPIGFPLSIWQMPSLGTAKCYEIMVNERRCFFRAGI